jgi:hypothetical protein
MDEKDDVTKYTDETVANTLEWMAEEARKRSDEYCEVALREAARRLRNRVSS